MNDEFLYDLRRRPPTEFALRLKSKLDQQQAKSAQRRRSFAWFVAGGLLVGSGALAMVSPVILQVGRDFIVQLRSDGEQTEHAQTAKPQARTYSPSRWDLARNPNDQSAKAEDAIPAPEPDPASEFQAPSSALAPAPGSPTHVALAPNGLPRTTLRLAYEPQFADLASRLAMTVEKRSVMTLAVELDEWPRAAHVCDPSSGASRVNVLISEFRFLQGSSTTCNGFVEMPFAFRAIAVVVNAESEWLKHLTMDDLRRLRESEGASQLVAWNQLRREWPTVTPVVFGTSLMGSDLGRRVLQTTKWQSPPSAYRTTDDDASTLAQVERTFGAIGFVDFVGWRQARSVLPLASIAGDDAKPVELNMSTVQNGEYPLRKTIWMYVRADRTSSWGTWQAIKSLPMSKAVEEADLVPLGTNDQRELTKLMNPSMGLPR